MNGIQIAPSPDKNSTQGGNLVRAGIATGIASELTTHFQLPLMNNDNPGQPQQVVVPQVPMVRSDDDEAQGVGDADEVRRPVILGPPSSSSRNNLGFLRSAW